MASIKAELDWCKNDAQADYDAAVVEAARVRGLATYEAALIQKRSGEQASDAHDYAKSTALERYNNGAAAIKEDYIASISSAKDKLQQAILQADEDQHLSNVQRENASMKLSVQSKIVCQKEEKTEEEVVWSADSNA